MRIVCLGYIGVVVFVITTVTSGRVARENSSKRCTLPQHPENGRWDVSGPRTTLSPGRKVSSGTTINVRCNGQYALDGSSLIECNNGKWTKKLGTCLQMCPPVAVTSSTKVTCNINGKSKNNCLKPTNGTVAVFTCAPFYENAEVNRNPFRFCSNGKWNEEIPICTPVCGVKPKSKGSKTKGYYPWNAAIFVKENEGRSYTCTGTLINERTILTAAHCIADQSGNKHPVSQFTVAVGKSSTEYQNDEDKEAQYSDIQDMFVPKGFRGSVRKYFADIAILITKEPFIMTKRVQPACLDWSNKYLEEFETPTDASLSIAGPLFRTYYPLLKNITEVPITLANETTCYNQLSSQAEEENTNFESFYTASHMYCSEYINPDTVFKCLVDQGVGLVTENLYDKKYYVIGVLTAFPSIHRVSCENRRWTIYTKISQYISNFITPNINLYVPISRSYFQTSCGIKSVKAKTLIVNGTDVTKGDYPWQVAIYRIEGSQKTFICGGSLLNERVILTAAHCVTDLNGNLYSKELYGVGVGKYYRKFNDPRDTEAQFSSLKHIFVPSIYQGDIQNYAGDIAILVTENSFVLTRQVHPVCVDWDIKYESQFLKPSVTGYVVGWGYTQENQSPSEELKYLEVPYVDRSQCKKKLLSDYKEFLTDDKMCSGFLNEGKSVCNGDSGGGLVFKNNNDDRYYIAGIVSLAPQAPTGGCNSQQYALYTRVSPYVREFILDKVRLYWA